MAIQLSATVAAERVNFISGRETKALETKIIATFEDLDDERLWPMIYTALKTTPGIASVIITPVENPNAGA